MCRAIDDLPNGESFAAFIEKLLEVAPARIPVSLREAIASQEAREAREELDRAQAARLVEHVGEVEPIPFMMAAAPPETAKTARETRSRARAAKGTTKKRVTKPKPREVSEEMEAWMREVLLDRLAGAPENGLSEMVLIAGTKHRGRTEYPTMTDRQVKVVLKLLLELGQAKVSASRWRIAGRHW